MSTNSIVPSSSSAAPVSNSTINLYYNPITLKHKNVRNTQHPECPARLTTTLEILKSKGVIKKCAIKSGRKATVAELLMVHSPAYIKKLLKMERVKSYEKSEKDYNSIYFNEFTLSAALVSAGMSLCAAQDLLLTGKPSMVLCRPPGHHASYDKASGFCIFNNVILAATLLATHKRVLIFDWDVHHGDGTLQLVSKIPNAKLITVQRYDHGTFYPGTGGTYKYKNSESIGFSGEMTGKQYLELFHKKVLPVIHEYNPDVILLSAGFDTARGDPMGGCELDPVHYHAMTKKLLEECDGQLIAFLEGGYFPKAVGHGVNAILNAFSL